MGSSTIQGHLWSEAAADWANLQEYMHAPLFEAMLNATIVRENTKFLDIGCGSGTSSARAAMRGAIVTGLDAAPALIEIARSRVPDGTFEIGDMENLPYEDNSFDVVFAANSIQYASDRTNALKELKRVCRDAGYIVLGFFGQAEVVDYKVIFKAVASTLPEPPAGDGPFGLSSYDKLDALFKSAGLEILTCQNVNCPMVFPDRDTFLRATLSGGPVVATIEKVGRDKVEDAVSSAIEPMTTKDGEIRIEKNHFQYLVAKV